MSKIFSLAAVGALAPCLTMAAPSVSNAQGYGSGYGPGCSPGYSNYTTGYGNPGYGGYTTGYGGYGSGYSSGYGVGGYSCPPVRYPEYRYRTYSRWYEHGRIPYREHSRIRPQ